MVGPKWEVELKLFCFFKVGVKQLKECEGPKLDNPSTAYVCTSPGSLCGLALVAQRRARVFVPFEEVDHRTMAANVDCTAFRWGV